MVRPHVASPTGLAAGVTRAGIEYPDESRIPIDPGGLGTITDAMAGC